MLTEVAFSPVVNVSRCSAYRGDWADPVLSSWGPLVAPHDAQTSDGCEPVVRMRRANV